MKVTTTIIAIFLSIISVAQNSYSSAIKASDPTQIYTLVEAYAGLNFLSNSPTYFGRIDTWEAGFRGMWGIKKFRIGVHLPASNNQSNYRVFDDITLDAGFQIHNNSGIYNATVIGAGFVSPSQNLDEFHQDYFYNNLFIYPNSSVLNKYYFNYLGAIKLSEKLSFYPGVEWFQRSKTDQTFYLASDSTHSLTPAVYSFGFKFSLAASYNFNSKSFIQLNGSWSTEDWQGKYGSDELNFFYSSISEQRLSLALKYQYAIKNNAQVFAQLSYYNLDSSNQYSDSYYSHSQLYGFRLGFMYFLQ